MFEGCRGEGSGATAPSVVSVPIAGVFRAHSGRAGSSGFAKSRFRILLEADGAELPPLYWLHWFSLSESPELPLPLSSSSSWKSMGESANESSGEGFSTEDATPTEAAVAAAPDVVESAAAEEEEAKPVPPAAPPPDALRRHIMLLNDLDARSLEIESSKDGRLISSNALNNGEDINSSSIRLIYECKDDMINKDAVMKIEKEYCYGLSPNP